MMHDANRGLHKRGGKKIHATESNLRSELTDGVFQIPHLWTKHNILSAGVWEGENAVYDSHTQSIAKIEC